MSRHDIAQSTRKHTPGPWQVCPCDPYVIETVATQAIAQVRVRPFSAEIFANGKLLAAAPELAKALLAAPEFGGEPTTAFGHAYREWQQQARAALRKAGVTRDEPDPSVPCSRVEAAR